MISNELLLSTARELEDGAVRLPLELCNAAMAAQACHDLGILSEKHVVASVTLSVTQNVEYHIASHHAGRDAVLLSAVPRGPRHGKLRGRGRLRDFEVLL